MELSRKSCRICLSETEFNVSLFGIFSRRTNLLEKILFCVKVVIDETDFLTTICFKCADNIERYYDFISLVKKCQSRLENEKCTERPKNIESSPNVNRRHITSYVREQVYDADYTFSFLEMADNEEKKESKTSSPFFSYFSPPNKLVKPSVSEPAWKTPRPRADAPKAERARKGRRAEGRHHSRDLFDSQSQELEEAEPRSLDWRLTPDDNIINRVREKCFGRSDF